MSKRTQRTFFLILGFFLQVMGSVVIPEEGYLFTALDAIGLTLVLVGTFFWFYGFYLWANLKGRHWANMFWGFLTWIGVIVLALMEDRSRYRELPNEEFQRCLVYLEEEWKLKAFQDKEAELYNNALVKYAGSMVSDSLASKEMCKAANRLAESATEIVRRRASMASIPNVASATYLKWQTTYSDYSAWATAQCAAIEALADGIIPNSQRVKELLSQSEKNRSQAEKEEKKVMKCLGLRIDEVSKMLSNASAAVAADNWQPRRRRQTRTKKEDSTSFET